MDRRTVLTGTGLAFSAALAGCSELDDEQGEEDDEDFDEHDEDLDDDLDDDPGESDDPGEDDSGDDHEDQEVQEGEEPDQDQGDEQPDDEEEYKTEEAEEDEEETEDDEEDSEDDDEDDEQEVAEDVEGEVLMPDHAEDHIEVRNHALTRRGSEENECEVHVELERISSNEYDFDFAFRVRVYDDDGEELSEKDEEDDDDDIPEEGESRVYSVSLDDCGETVEYEFEVTQFDIEPPRAPEADNLEEEHSIDSEIEDKIKVEDVSFSWDSEPAPKDGLHDQETQAPCNISGTVTNVSEDYFLEISVTAGGVREDGDIDGNTSKEYLGPEESAEIRSVNSCSSDLVGYGVEVEANEVRRIAGPDDVTDLEGEVIISERAQEYVEVTEHGIEEQDVSGSGEDTEWCVGEVEVVNIADHGIDEVSWLRCRCTVRVYQEGERAYESRELLDEESERSDSSYTTGETFEFSLPLQGCGDATEYEVEVEVPDVQY